MMKHLIRFLVMVSFLLTGAQYALAQEVPPDEPIPGEDIGETPGGEVDPYSVYSKGQLQETYIDEDYKLYEVRPYKGVLESDECAWVSGSPPESGTTCADHIGFDV